MRNVHGREREPARVRMGRACQYAPAGARTRAAAGARVGRAQARARTKGVCKARACVGSRTHACRRARMQAACRRVRTYARVQAHIHSRLCRLRFESKPSIQISKYPFATGAIGPLSDLGGRFLGGYTMCLQVTARSRLHNSMLLARGGVNKPTVLLIVLCLLCASTALAMPESVREQLADIEHMSTALHAKMAATDEHMATMLLNGAHLEWAAEFVECREQMLRRESYSAEESARRVQDLRHEVFAESEAGIPTPDPMCMPCCRLSTTLPHPSSRTQACRT